LQDRQRRVLAAGDKRRNGIFEFAEAGVIHRGQDFGNALGPRATSRKNGEREKNH